MKVSFSTPTEGYRLFNVKHNCLLKLINLKNWVNKMVLNNI